MTDDITEAALSSLEEKMAAHPVAKSAYCADSLAEFRFHLHVHAPQVLAEIRRHRAAQRVDTERVKAVVSQAVADVIALNAAATATVAEIHVAGVVLGKAVAHRVAEQLASMDPMLSAEERRALQEVRDEIANTWNVEYVPVTPDSRLWQNIRLGVATLDRLIGRDK